MIQDILIIVINLKKYPERLVRLQKRLDFHGLKNIHIIHPDLEEPRFLDFIKASDSTPAAPKNVPGSKPILNCLFSHLEAYRYFLSTGISRCIIMEDDAMLHNDFCSKLDGILSGKPTCAKSILLSPYFGELLNYNRRITPDLYVMAPTTYSMTCYYIERDFAMYSYDIYGHPLREYPSIWIKDLTSEILLINTVGSVLVYPPLAVEECLDSELNDHHLQGKKKYWSYYGYENYSSAENITLFTHS
jgi:GR25 family glycosyltransferase involved in LPS biosynthesis